MIKREEDLTTYIGSGVAIPHGVGEAKKFIKKSGLVVLQFPEGVDFGDEKAHLVIGIAGVGDEHIEILSNIATVIGEDEDKVKELMTTKDVNFIYETFTKV
jgi:mannitol/fructose-specific phosphotransferase system IIA component